MVKDLLFKALVTFVLFLSFIQAITPPIGNDALAYHLYHPNGIGYVQYSRESLWPYLTEWLFMSAMAIHIEPALVHWAFFPIITLTIYRFCMKHYNKGVAQLASLIFLFTPIAFYQSSHAYVDLSLAFFVLLSIITFIETENYWLIGAMVGLVCSVKYLGLGVFLIIFLLTVFRTKKVMPLIKYTLAWFAVCGFWYIRSWILLGNPVYPFFPQLFGHGYQFDAGAGVGMGKGLIAFLMFPFNITFFPKNFGGEIIGPLLLIFSPFALSTKIKSEIKYLIVFTLLYTAFLFTQSQQARFYLTVIPMISIASGLGVKRCLES